MTTKNGRRRGISYGKKRVRSTVMALWKPKRPLKKPNEFWYTKLRPELIREFVHFVVETMITKYKITLTLDSSGYCLQTSRAGDRLVGALTAADLSALVYNRIYQDLKFESPMATGAIYSHARSGGVCLQYTTFAMACGEKGKAILAKMDASDKPGQAILAMRASYTICSFMWDTLRKRAKEAQQAQKAATSSGA